MSEVAVNTSLTLDGVMQAPGRADEDTRGGFARGGWAVPYNDQVMADVMAKGIARAGPLLLGRRTYEDFGSFWPHQGEDNPYAAVMNSAPKLVASRTLEAPLAWTNSTLLEGDATDAVARLKEEPGPDVVVLGSGELAASLMRRDLVDRWVLLIHPLVLGTGRRLFADDGTFAALRLIDSVTTTKGVVIATYERGGR